jgi:hypothetical protein
MSKKMMLSALVVLVALLALPGVGSAQEIHLEPGKGETFSISGLGVEARAEEEPTVTCDKVSGSGKFDTASSTTGFMTRDYTGCHLFTGITIPCQSEGSPVNNTVATAGAFHLITWQNAKGEGFPAILMTTEPVAVLCAGIKILTFTGSVIGTIISPKCGESSKELKLSLTATEKVQNHLTYTGVNYDLLLQTNSGAAKTAALVGAATATSTNAQKLNCT